MTTTEHDIDILIGQRLRAARIERELSQTDLADQLDITYQQLQKYESAKNRISASKLHRACTYLLEPIQEFFEEPIEPDSADPLIVHLVHRWPRLDERTRRAIADIAGIH